MNAKEARTLLSGQLIFGDSAQILAHKTLGRILEAKEIISGCWREHLKRAVFAVKKAEKPEYLENLEEEVLDCAECKVKFKAAEGLHADELLAAVAELFDEWWGARAAER